MIEFTVEFMGGPLDGQLLKGGRELLDDGFYLPGPVVNAATSVNYGPVNVDIENSINQPTPRHVHVYRWNGELRGDPDALLHVMEYEGSMPIEDYDAQRPEEVIA